MKLVTAVFLLCLFLREASLFLSAPSADELTKTNEKATSFYSWLEKYQTPAPQSVTQGASQPQQIPKPVYNAPLAEQFATSEQENNHGLSPDDSPPVWKAGNETVEPGEGLGCYYHRSYYSHLPLFNDSSDFSLLGSLEVAEPYQKSLNGTSVSTEGE